MKHPSPHDSDPENGHAGAVAFSVLVLSAIALVLGSLLFAYVEYGDWRCAFRKCGVVVAPMENPPRMESGR